MGSGGPTTSSPTAPAPSSSPATRHLSGATHKHPVVRAWLAKHPRFHLHFTPTSSSWLNLLERFFADLTAQVVREGSFGSVKELTGAIETYLAERNLTPKPYRWRAKGADILAKIHRARAAQQLCHGIS